MNYLKIEAASLSNGMGWRVVLWLSGCSHACPGCHNPETWDCLAGKRFGEKEIALIDDLLNKPYIKGITLTGGDPLFEGNRSALLEYVKELKAKHPNKDIWLYTGYCWDDIKDIEIIKYIDVIIDGKFIEKQRDISLPFRGSSNQNIIDAKKSLKEKSVVLYEVK